MEENSEETVTMMDVLQKQQEFEEDANAVLGASDDKNCTFSKGYVKRQALYSCLTCCTEPSNQAAVCLACSLRCHENHELIELYTKRNFRCDCGNSKFKAHCQFNPDKTDLNDDNKYNHNFSGKYCTCKRPYPDPEGNDDDDDMIQCIICEDWLHANHLEATVPPNNQYAEMICKDCMNDNLFLHDYTRYAVGASENGYVEVEEEEGEDAFNGTETNEDQNKIDENEKPKEDATESPEKEKTESDGDVPKKSEAVCNPEEPKEGADSETLKDTEEKPAEDEKKDDTDNPDTNGDESHKRKLTDDETEVCTKKSKIEICTKPKGGKIIFEGATFWPSDFRQKLCSCSKCVEMYKDLCVLYLIDPEDTVTAYETLGKENLEGSSQYEQGMQALSSLGHVQQINALTEYNIMKDKLIDFLKNFKDRKEIVKEEDIKTFFAGMKAKRDPDGVYFCR